MVDRRQPPGAGDERDYVRGLGVDPALLVGRTPEEPPPAWWKSALPLMLLVAAGVAIGAATLVKILSGVGRDRVSVLEARLPDGAAGAGAEDEVDPQRRALAASVDQESIRGWIDRLSSEALGGRDAPSRGLDQAQAEVAAALRSLGLVPADELLGMGTLGPLDRPLADPDLRPYLHRFTASAAFFGRVPYEAPDPAASYLEIDDGGPPLVLGQDFVPLASSSPEDPTFRGEASGPVRFAGFGIDSRVEAYDDFAAGSLRGQIALVLAGEPEGGAFEGRFGGPELTAEACVWNKLDALEDEHALGALVVASRSPLEFRHTRAYWSPPSMDRVRGGVPTLVVTEAVAERLLGASPAALRREIESAGSALRNVEGKARIRLGAATRRAELELRNVVALLPGSRATPDGPLVIIGAHLDHIGVGPRGRVGRGADDNASGVAALLAVARALAAPEGRELLGEASVLFCAFTGEEDGRVGSAAVVKALAPSKARCAAMINLDMVGRGAQESAVVFGLVESPTLRAPFLRALRSGQHGLSKVKEVTSPSFFQRSDHYEFWSAGIPSLFLFEAWPHELGVYHTWRDTPELVSATKVASVARLALLVALELLE